MELDLVYTWIDGSKPHHLISRLWHFIQYVKTSDNRINRWANRNELKFLLRSINSSVIEFFLNKIPGLSEFFIYSNDDVFFLRPMIQSDFFSENKANIFLNPIVSIDDQLSNYDNGHVFGKKNANGLLSSIFGYQKRMLIEVIDCDKTTIKNFLGTLFPDKCSFECE